MRAARDENGKTYYVPASTTYEEWANAFAGGGNKDFFRSLAVRGQKIHDIPIREQNVEVPKEILSEVDMLPTLPRFRTSLTYRSVSRLLPLTTGRRKRLKPTV